MTRSTVILAAVGVMLLILSVPAAVMGSTTASDVTSKAKETWETFKAYVIDQKGQAVEHGKEILKEVDAKIEELQAKASEASGEVKARYQEEIEKLKALRARCAEKLDALQDSSAEAWDAAKQGFTDASQDLHRAYDEAVQKFQ